MIRGVYKVWMRIARAIGWVNTRVLLLVFFYLVIAPMGLFIRVIGKDLLGLKIEKNVESYWVKRPSPIVEPAHYEKQF